MAVTLNISTTHTVVQEEKRNEVSSNLKTFSLTIIFKNFLTKLEQGLNLLVQNETINTKRQLKGNK